MKIRELIEMVAWGNTELDSIEAHATRMLADIDRAVKPFNIPATLPADPENMNNDRAEWAGNALAFFAHDHGEFPHPDWTEEERRAIMAQNLSDLLAGLAHYCDRAGLNFEEWLNTARYHYQAETAGQGTQLQASAEPQPPAALNAREVATILHALRTVQVEGRLEGCAAGMCDHFVDVEQMTNAEIDALCERLNFGDIAGNPGGDIWVTVKGGVAEVVEAPASANVHIIDWDDIEQSTPEWIAARYTEEEQAFIAKQGN